MRFNYLLSLFFSINLYSQSSVKFEIRNSNYNELNLPQTIENIGSSFDSIFGYRREIKYDPIGNVVEEKIFSKLEKIVIETIKFKYDRYNNIIEISRSNDAGILYPKNVDGGFPIYANEKYIFRYDKRGRWIKKTLIIKNKKMIVEKRKFI